MRLLVFFLKIAFLIKLAMPIEKMLLFYGKIVKFNKEAISITVTDLDSCVQNCFEESTFILAFWNSSGYCNLFGFSSFDEIREIESDEGDVGQYLAVKADLPNNTCPAFPFETDIKRPGNQTWKSGNGWTTRLCKAGWTLFSRPDSIFVCLKFFELKLGTNRTVALQTCVDNGAIMTGLATRSEVYWLTEFIVAPLQTGQWDGIWLNGMRDCSSNTNKTCQNFVWSDGYTIDTELLKPGFLWDPGYVNNQQDCLAVISSISDLKLNMVNCTSYDVAIGVACGYQFK
ncbi:CW domain-containing protein [Caenorhabditis elegans]|uniref:CW domain-containing protein n=1 Tax=Caenorhabditis elegans TaxID=6239 RepID=O45492_CAEEL|nr:CW domain-containing protein [Caenorhabditis elegans]CAB05192.1 CW domain-containing protein [Caenorhabditis elegans]|eukprot:NP_502932.1 C-type LECtin [Caenorhabditis elegans]